MSTMLKTSLKIGRNKYMTLGESRKKPDLVFGEIGINNRSLEYYKL